MTDRTQPSSRTASNAQKPAADTSSFEAQLSAALAESLQKLGVQNGEVNISIRNPTSSTRQIVVTYSTEGAPAAAIEPPATTPATTTPTTTTTPTASTTAPATKAATTTPAGMPPLAVSSTPNPFNLDLGYTAPAPVIQLSYTPWAPSFGPKDFRDEIPQGGGKVTASGAPLIQDNVKAAGNQSSYTGPAAQSPYFSTPSNPLRPGYVLGFEKWFENPKIHGGPNGPQQADRKQYATEEGAQEALRIVQKFAPDATLVKSVWQSGPYGIDTYMYEVELGGGRRLNAGGVLCAYYTQGYGVPASADETIRRSMELA